MSSQPLKSGDLDASTTLAIHRTDLALENTLMGADRTQMSVLRTSLSLIGFGFTIYKFFQEIGKGSARVDAFGPPARNFGLFLVILGILLLIAGIVSRNRVVKALGRRQKTLYQEGLSKMSPAHKTSPNMIISIMLLIGGMLVLLGIAARIGPFS